MSTRVATIVAALLVAGSPAHAREPVVGLPCEGCEAVFEGLPADIASHARIAADGEPGESMAVSGRVLDGDGQPVAGIIVYAYQTDATGSYPAPRASHGPASDRHGALRGWARSDTDGRYHFDTIRPASYPGRDVPAHIHLHVIEPQCATYYIDDIMFTDDPLLTAAARRRLAARAGDGVATPVRNGQHWQVTRDIELGANIPGYPACGGGGAET